jgi:hypothetical protein
VEPVASIDYAPTEPAPGRLALVERFANTVDPEHGREALHSPERLRALLLELGLLDRGVRVTERDLAAARDLRDGIRALALANNGVPTRAARSSRTVATSPARSPSSSGSCTRRRPTARGRG